MQVERLSNEVAIKKYLQDIGVDKGGVQILASKARHYTLFIGDLHVGAANILKQDALSAGADLAVPRGTVTAKTEYVDCILIATQKQLRHLSKKELAQPFGLQDLAKKLQEILKVKEPQNSAVMGIINANDDSFFQGSRFRGAKAVEAIERMIEEGADIIDIGGVSSAPQSIYPGAREELERVKPILKSIKEQKLYEKISFSIDSYEPQVISFALESGFQIVNDITGLVDDRVCRLCSEYNAAAVIMHMQNKPPDMQKNPHYERILSDIYSFFEQRIQKAESFGVKEILLDVGIGFGKTLEHNLILIKHLRHFATLGKPLLVGASRKSMINTLFACEPQERLGGTLALHLEAVRNGASVIRVHDVFEHLQALKIQQALRSV